LHNVEAPADVGLHRAEAPVNGGKSVRNGVVEALEARKDVFIGHPPSVLHLQALKLG
jgi:hypothetical protein